MAIKQLQNNYTTPEQSKRLLELGLPADSADKWWEKDETIRINGEWVHGADWDKVPSPFGWNRDENRIYTYTEIKKTVEDFTGYDTLPCWSVGRLIEIAIKCNTSEDGKLHLSFNEPLNDSETLVTRMVKELADVEFGWYDFSKLEE